MDLWLKAVFDCCDTQKTQLVLKKVITTLKIIVLYQMMSINKSLEILISLLVKSSICEHHNSMTFLCELLSSIEDIQFLILRHVKSRNYARISSFRKHYILTCFSLGHYRHHFTTWVKRKYGFCSKSVKYSSNFQYDLPWFPMVKLVTNLSCKFNQTTFIFAVAYEGLFLTLCFPSSMTQCHTQKEIMHF